MKSVNVRELTHHFSGYLKAVKSGQRIVVMERHTPVADLVPHNENLTSPGWKRPIKRIKVKGGSFSDAVVKMRREER